VQRTISYSCEVYGSDARVSAAADFVELLALSGRSITLADLADFFEDSANVLSRDRYTLQSSGIDDDLDNEGNPLLVPGDDGLEPSREAARRIMALLDQRRQILGKLYPFELEEGRVTRRKLSRPSRSPYVVLLAVATAHAYNLSVGHNVTKVFERSVARAFRKRVPRTSAFAEARGRPGATFAAAIEQTGEELGLPMSTAG